MVMAVADRWASYLQKKYVVCATGRRFLNHGVSEDSSAKDKAGKLKNRKIRDMVPHLGTCLIYLVQATITTFSARLLAGLLGIKFGRGCSFRGLPLLRRMPNTTIRVCQRCVFNSRSEYNMIGISIIRVHHHLKKLSLRMMPG
jgi:hypothetical protein